MPAAVFGKTVFINQPPAPIGAGGLHHGLESIFSFPQYSIKLDSPERIQKIAMMINAIRQPLETSATKIKVYKANTLKSKQMTVVISFTLFVYPFCSLLNFFNHTLRLCTRLPERATEPVGHYGIICSPTIKHTNAMIGTTVHVIYRPAISHSDGSTSSTLRI